MHISITGKGPTILFLHGFCESSTIWTSFEEALHLDYEIVLIDLPGHGLSKITNSEFTIDEVARDIHSLLKENHIHEYFVIGHSLGGYIALALADLFSSAITGFGLFQSSTFADDKQKKLLRGKVKSYVEEHGVASFTDTFVPTLFAHANKTLLKKEIKILQLEAKKTQPQGVIAFSMAMKSRPDRLHILKNFQSPVFIIGGEEDPAVPIEISSKMIKNINNGESIILKNTGHNGFLEKEKESLFFISNFLYKYLGESKNHLNNENTR